jgi:hypothetical protein
MITRYVVGSVKKREFGDPAGQWNTSPVDAFRQNIEIILYYLFCFLEREYLVCALNSVLPL